MQPQCFQNEACEGQGQKAASIDNLTIGTRYEAMQKIIVLINLVIKMLACEAPNPL